MPPPPTRALGALVAEVAQRLARGGPPPRGLPCFGLESMAGTATALLDALAAHGIFRKYERVLVVDDGLGQTARWLAGGRLGCRAVGTARDPDAAAAASRLTRRARLAAAVQHVAASDRALPFADASFTHVWAIGSLAAEAADALAEVRRVLRPGGHVAVQDVGGIEAEARRAQLEAAGFSAVQVRDVTREAAERSARVSAARETFALALRASGDAALVAEADRREGFAVALARGALRITQLIARRP